MATLKYSRQRESIKEFLMTRTDHPTADVVYHHLREVYPNISLGTVYRNLSLLADLGRFRKSIPEMAQTVLTVRYISTTTLYVLDVTKLWISTWIICLRQNKRQLHIFKAEFWDTLLIFMESAKNVWKQKQKFPVPINSQSRQPSTEI